MQIQSQKLNHGINLGEEEERPTIPATISCILYTCFVNTDWHVSLDLHAILEQWHHLLYFRLISGTEEAVVKEVLKKNTGITSWYSTVDNVREIRCEQKNDFVALGVFLLKVVCWERNHSHKYFTVSLLYRHQVASDVQHLNCHFFPLFLQFHFIF